MGKLAQFLDANDRFMTPLTRDLRIGHVMWGIGLGTLTAWQVPEWADPILGTMLLTGGFAGMVHGYIRDRHTPTSEPSHKEGGGE